MLILGVILTFAQLKAANYEVNYPSRINNRMNEKLCKNSFPLTDKTVNTY